MKKSAITTGQIGLLLPLAAFIPIVGYLSGLASTILLLISYNYFSKHYNEPKIFNNYLWAFITMYVSVFLGIGFIMATIGSQIMSFVSSFNYISDFEDILHNTFTYKLFFAIGFIYIAQIVGYYLQYQAKKKLSERTKVKEFATSGLLEFIGSITIVVVGLGLIVMFIGWIFEIVAFFNIKEDDQVIQQNQYTN